ncbi:hypothetical protein EMCG_05231 [[Emmonsia] crescens]|uniref:Restriction endonuclease domain-containing protein n=1 Tax=[Emmonsia] crescens TaxID=73230 RepID=A0A0G2HQL5_9EURO|nr:hypothetical protein EMCG_05231 [Emmonsia crescens UAMH 3008]
MSSSTPNESIHNAYDLRSKGPNISPKLTAQQLFITTRRAIIEATDSKELVFENIDSTTGFDVVRSLNACGEVERALPRIHYNSRTETLRIRIMPTHICDTHQEWISNEMADMQASGFLTLAERKYLRLRVGTTFQNFQGPYAFSSKEPDLAILPNAQPLPTIVVESCWSESDPKLQQDVQLWLEGGAPTVQLVMLLEWSKSSATQVKGRIEVHGRNSAGTIGLLQAENIFPISSESPQPTIAVTRGQLFGSAVFAGRNTFDSYPLSIANLRQLAAPLIQNMGYTPA